MKALVPRLLLALSLAAPAALAEETAPPPGEAGKADEPAAAPDVAAQVKLKTEKHEDEAAKDEAPKDQAAPKKEDKETGEEDTYGHGMQFGIRAGIGFGYRMYFRYDKSPLCQKFDTAKEQNDQIKSCGFGSPPAADVAISFAPFDSVEPFLFMRFGLSGESRTNTNALQLLGIGARVYTMSDSRFKIFLEPALAYETEGGAGNADWIPSKVTPPPGHVPYTLTTEYKKDLVFHVGVGPQYDFAKAFGIFLTGGVDVGVLRAISANLHATFGAQLRFP